MQNPSEAKRHTYSSNFITEFLQYRYYNLLSFKGEKRRERTKTNLSLQN